MMLSTIPCLTLLLCNLFNPMSSFDTGVLGNMVDAVNNKYNTFSLVEYLMNDLEDYMGVAYTELKRLIMTKMNQTQTSVKSTGRQSDTTSRSFHTNYTDGNNSIANKNLSKPAKKPNTHHENISTYIKNKQSVLSTSQISNQLHHNISNHHFNTFNGNKSERKNKYIQHFSENKNLTKLKSRNLNNITNLLTLSSQFNGNHSNDQSNNSHNGLIDRFLNNKILNYYKYLHRKYGNTSYYGAVKLIVDNYFKQFRAEINKIKYNVTNDIKDMKSDLVKLYYETTSTTECVDSLIIHYIENKTHDLETYVKQTLHLDKKVNKTGLVFPIHTAIGMNNTNVDNRNHFISQSGRNNCIYKGYSNCGTMSPNKLNTNIITDNGLQLSKSSILYHKVDKLTTGLKNNKLKTRKLRNIIRVL